MNSSDCSSVDKTSSFEMILSILLIISEILPFIKSVKSNGLVQAIHFCIFHRDEANTTELLPIYRST